MTLNLSCGKCKAIQPFSGMPPTCEVCDWVCSTTNMRALVGSPRTTNSTNTVTGGGSFFPRRTSTQVTTGLGNVAESSAGCFAVLLVIAFWAACALVAIAVVVWAWHYLFG